MDIPEFNCELDRAQSSLYNVNMYTSAIPESNRATTLLDPSKNQSRKSQHDPTAFTDLRPYTAHYSDITCPDANYMQPCMGLPTCCDESCQALYRSAAEYDLRPYTAHYNDITYPDANYIQPPMGLPNVSNYSDGRCQDPYRSSTADYDLRPYTAHYNDITCPDANYSDGSCQDPYRSSSADYVICQNGNNSILYMNNPDTGEIKTYHLLSHPEEQFRYNLLNSDRSENRTRYPGCEQTFQYPVFQYSTDTPNPPPMLRNFLPIAPSPHTAINNMTDRSVYALSDEIYHPESNIQGTANLPITDIPDFPLDNNKSRRPCNCTKSQCLKLYCDCFANGEFCSNCNCNNCCNNIYHQHERIKAIKACLDRNPEAFRPKIGKVKTGDVKPRHTKGCNCKRSGCLKNYCECYEGKIMCSSLCKCIHCKNYEDDPEHKSVRNMQRERDAGSIVRICTSMGVVRATCACLLAQAEEAEKQGYSVSLAQQKVIQEFGKCLTQILQRVVPGETCS